MDYKKLIDTLSGDSVVDIFNCSNEAATAIETLLKSGRRLPRPCVAKIAGIARSVTTACFAIFMPNIQRWSIFAQAG